MNEQACEEQFPDFKSRILQPKQDFFLKRQPYIYQDISEHISSRLSQESFSNPDIQEQVNLTLEPDSIKTLTEGTLKLINTVLSQDKAGEPFDTLLFLDKSARNGAFMLRLLFNELKTNNKLPRRIKLPKIRFINIGMGDNQEKFTDQKAIALIRHIYNPKDFDQKTIGIVDEYSQTGNSIDMASKIIQKNFKPVIYKLNQFDDEVPWYGYSESGTSGILDSNSSERQFIAKPIQTPEQKDNFNSYRSVLKSIVLDFAKHLQI